MAGRVCVIGSANMDMVVRAQKLPAPGETVVGNSFHTSPGGKGANQAVAAARMGARVTMVGRLGADASGTELRKVLSREGVDLTAVRTAAGVPTGVALITVDEDSGENTIVGVGGANLLVSPEDVRAVAGLIRSAEVLLMQLEVPVETVEAATTLARGAGRMVILNAAPAQPLPQSLLSSLDVLIINETEAAAIAGEASADDPEQLAETLRGTGPAAVVLTLGGRGAIVAEQSGTTVVPSIKVAATDTVGAGDAFCGTVAAMRAEGKSLAQAVRIGCIAGALATTKPGAISSLPTREAVREAVGEAVGEILAAK
ncbi:MAG: ribokinase [Planctomycetota bacterium]|nr:ribokinase [Planctomycetota bacterium]